MSKNLPVVVVSAIFLLIAGGITFMVKNYGPGTASDTGDPTLEQLARTNPALEVTRRLEDSANRVPTYWVQEKSSGHEVLMPRSLADEGNATIAFTSCAAAPIPPRLLPSNASTPICMLISDSSHKLNAFYFSAKGRVSDMVDFYDGAKRPNENRRLSFRWEEESMRQAVLPDGKMGFAYSYYLYGYGTGTDFSVAALVGYKRDGIPAN
jgi:hypothetical protein